MQRIIRELADKVGMAEAFLIVMKWGGRDFYVPTAVNCDDPLALTLGIDTARQLVRHFGGQWLQLPGERSIIRRMRNDAIVRDSESMSQQNVALRYGLTRQAVAHIVANHRKSSKSESELGAYIAATTKRGGESTEQTFAAAAKQ